MDRTEVKVRTTVKRVISHQSQTTHRVLGQGSGPFTCGAICGQIIYRMSPAPLCTFEYCLEVKVVAARGGYMDENRDGDAALQYCSFIHYQVHSLIVTRTF